MNRSRKHSTAVASIATAALSQLAFAQGIVIPSQSLAPGAEHAAPNVAPTPINPSGRGGCGSTFDMMQAAAMLARKQAGIADVPVEFLPRYALTVRIKFVRVRPSTSDDMMSDAELDAELAGLNAYFAPIGVAFQETEPRQVITNSTHPFPLGLAGRYYNIRSHADFDALLNENTIAGTLDICFINSGVYDEGTEDEFSICGQATFPGDPNKRGIVIINGCSMARGNPSVTPHEVGHYFDLLHTHETSHGQECPNGWNCSFTGDLVCDTPADPGLSAPDNDPPRTDGSCNVLVNNLPDIPQPLCSFPPTDYNPDGFNFMSYSDQLCSVAFSQGQRGRFMATVMGDRADHLIQGGDFNATWLDFSSSFDGGGSFGDPFKFLPSAVASVPVGGTIAIKSSNSNQTGRFTRAMRWDSWRGRSTIGR